MTSQTVSRKRTFKTLTNAKLDLLKRKTLKQRTLAKVKWAVRAYNEWRAVRIQDKNTYDELIFEANLCSLNTLTKESLCHALCRFIPEVTKVRDASEYPGKTLYEMIIAIQKYLNENEIPWKLVEGSDFIRVKTVLDNTMKEQAEANIGMVKKQAQFISQNLENTMWQKGLLGEDTPDKLRSTVLFLIGINCGM